MAARGGGREGHRCRIALSGAGEVAVPAAARGNERDAVARRPRVGGAGPRSPDPDQLPLTKPAIKEVLGIMTRHDP